MGVDSSAVQKLTMRSCISLCLIVCVVNSLPADIYRTEWQKFKTTYGKLYSSAEEETKRFHIFAGNLDQIIEHNESHERGLSSYKMAVNKFSDFTREEYQKMLGVLPNIHAGTPQNHVSDKEEEYRREWQAFKEKYGKLYVSQDEEDFRFKIFRNNLEKILNHNAKYDRGLTTFKMGINNFADMTEGEIQKYMGLLDPKYLESLNVENNCDLEWHKFKKTFGKVYSSSEESFRFSIFCENLDMVKKHNEDFENGLTTFKMGINQFSDMTEEELNKYMGFRPLRMTPTLYAVDDSCKTQYDEFKKSYNKVYDTEEDDEMHRNIFCKNLEMIREHNEMYKRAETSFKMGVNRFTDMTGEEIKRYLGFIDGSEHIGSAITTSQSEGTCKSQYEEYIKTFGKVYQSENDKRIHMKIFCENLSAIEKHNDDYKNGKTTYKMGVNKFTDMTPEEISEHMGFIGGIKKEYTASKYLPQDFYDKEWQKFKKNYNKTYTSQEEEHYRYQVFCENLDKIYKHNELFEAGQSSFKMGVNKYADMTHEEYLKYLHDGRLIF